MIMCVGSITQKVKGAGDPSALQSASAALGPGARVKRPSGSTLLTGAANSVPTQAGSLLGG
jgi:hypothetical protein